MDAWIAPLNAGNPESAWDLFVERYRRVIFGAIRRYAADPDDVMDVFARVCEALRANDFRRLRQYAAQADDRPCSTWLVAVVHNLTIDWYRGVHGRPRVSALAASFPPLRRRIFECVVLEQRSHVETYELLRSRGETQATFGEFLRELRATLAAVPSGGATQLVAELTMMPRTEGETTDDPAVLAERQTVLAEALAAVSAEDRLAVQLFVVDGVPAAEVARAMSLPNPKAVYNRVYRALAAIRERLRAAGIEAKDL